MLVKNLPVFVQRAVNTFITTIIYAIASQYHDIQSRQDLLVVSKAFSNKSLDSVSIYRSSNMLFGNSQTQTRVRLLIGGG